MLRIGPAWSSRATHHTVTAKQNRKLGLMPIPPTVADRLLYRTASVSTHVSGHILFPRARQLQEHQKNRLNGHLGPMGFCRGRKRSFHCRSPLAISQLSFAYIYCSAEEVSTTSLDGYKFWEHLIRSSSCHLSPKLLWLRLVPVKID